VRVLVLKLGEDDAAATVDLVSRHNGLNFRKVLINISLVRCAVVPQRHPRLDGEPCWEATIIPLRARVGPHPDDGVHSHLLDERQPRIKIKVIRKVPLSLRALGGIPEYVHLHAVEPHLLGPPDTVRP